MSVQTVHRLLSSLEGYGFVAKNPETKKFRLGLSLLKLGMAIKENSSIRNSALSVMEKLMSQTKEKVYLTVPEGNEGVFIDCVQPGFIVLDEYIGVRSALSIGAANKVILAHESRKKRQKIMQNLYKKGEISDLNQFEKTLNIIAKCGVSICFEEIKEGNAEIAAPIFSCDNHVTASISVISPSFGFDEQEIYITIQYVQNAAEEVSRNLGWKVRESLNF
ncbi:IclR family transcriptional regulator [Domibacillus sp. 8LH]|uniref:IclR family transcriptional regulator n=1 Tax=Domibacillus sp. 8LH TaxID=3073900 RepID=UPI003176DAE8